MRFQITFTLLVSSLLFQSCGGYYIRRSEGNALEKAGVRQIYISPIENDTYRYGVENVVYNALVRSMASFGGVRVVQDAEIADSVLTGKVTQADAVVASTTSAGQLNPINILSASSNHLQFFEFGSIYVASSYNAVLTCSFKLVRRNPGPKDKPVVWSGTFSRSSPYPATNQLGALGTTSALINDSEFDRTVLNVAHDMTIDVREAMVDRF
jgi:Lipopolysaccharide-assembly